MHHTLLVGSGQPLGQLRTQPQDFFRVQGAAGDLGVKADARDVFSDQEIYAIVFAKLVHGGHIGMIELGQ